MHLKDIKLIGLLHQSRVSLIVKLSFVISLQDLLFILVRTCVVIPYLHSPLTENHAVWPLMVKIAF
jgi:hypothetical protein